MQSADGIIRQSEYIQTSVCVRVRQCVNVYVCVVCAHLFDETQKHSAQCFELLLA